MRSRRIFPKLFSLYLVITLISVAAITVLSVHTVKNFYYSRTSDQLGAVARLVERDVRGSFATLSVAELDSICDELGRLASSRITFIAPDGTVLGDTDEDPARMENHADRPEIQAALSGKTGVSIRFSPTLKSPRMYLAIPLVVNGQIIGVVRASKSVAEIDRTLKRVYFWIALGGLIIAVLAAIVGYAAFRRITRPLVAIKKGADRFAAGDLGYRLHVEGSEEIGRLAQTLNEMAEQLQERIHTITRQHNELEAVLENMLEGVLAVDVNERILKINRAAEKILGINAADARGRLVPEVVRSSDLQDFIFRLLRKDGGWEEEIEIHSDDRWFQVHGTLLQDENGDRFGGLVVLNDITRLKKLETIRRDFVANVSHELRTPITALKGFVETLQDENYDSKEDAKRFLDIIARQTDRLNAIVADLLELSRIEQEAETGGIELEITNLEDVLERAWENCRIRAQEKGIAIELDCPDDLAAPVNAPLLEQAVTNLLDNAVNYSPEGAVIRLSVRETDAEIVIEVSDPGCGIEPQHLPRLFERFYRVDKNRSRELGGTGLGLAIVKHIALAHRGTVSVDSTPGAGSTFRIHLPK